MYAYIRGELQEVEENLIVVETMGIGYEIHCANPFDFQGQIGEAVKVYTYQYIREDSMTLYGFKKEEQKELFKKLLNVSGIGPKSAISIVGQSPVRDFALAIEREDEKFFTKFPGVGKKTARQMILDLKGKLTEWLSAPASADEVAASTPANNESGIHIEEALEALKTLGYSNREIQSIVSKLKAEEGKSADDFVRIGLKLLMR